MKKPIRIGERIYPSKTAATEAIREILYAYSLGETLSEEHAAFIADMLQLHPERDAKVGVGVRSFQVRQNEGTRCFWLTRTNGTTTDFSFRACLTPPTPQAEARAGFRTEIRDQIEAFRVFTFAGASTIPCAVTGESVHSTTAHVDHDPPFDALLAHFLGSIGLALGSVTVEPTRDGETITRLADRTLADAWSRFHRQYARLRVVSRRANLSLLRRQS